MKIGHRPSCTGGACPGGPPAAPVRIPASVAAAYLLVLASGCIHHGALGPLTVRPVRPADHAAITGPAGHPTIIVTSATGIGSMHLVRGAPRWPDRVTLGLRYAEGRPFTRLESLRIVAGALSCHTFLGCGDTVSCDDGSTTGPGGMPRLVIPVRPGEDALEAIIPARLLEAAGDTIAVEWVDVFRD